jgi:hypothetical protein
LVCSLLCAAAAAQPTIPSVLTTHWGERDLTGPWGRTSSRWQQVMDRPELPPGLQPGRAITHLGFRRQAAGTPVPAVALDTQLALYDVALTSATLGATFAANRSAAGGVAFARRVVTLPPAPLGSPASSWHLLPLDAPRVFVGPNLLVEVVNHGPQAAGSGWYANAAQGTGPDGLGRDVGRKCGNAPNMILSTGPYRPGATFRVTELYAAPAATPLNALRASATHWGAIALPLDLTPFGASDCSLQVGLDVVRASTSGPGANVDYAVPPLAIFQGARLYTQWLNLDAAANPLGVTLSAARALTLGSRTYGLAHTERENDTLDTSGNGPARGEGAVVVLLHN